MKENYQKWMEETIAGLKGRPRLLLHSCCAPCSSYVLTALAPHFDILLFYSNSNITSPEEYEHRLFEQERLIREVPCRDAITMMADRYAPEEFFAAARGMEAEPEGGRRCEACFRMRLTRAAQKAREVGADWFTTTLTISPHKNAQLLNAIGQELGEEYGVPYLCSDFKKKDGYKESIRLSGVYGLYRQNYCGCVFSREEARRREADREK